MPENNKSFKADGNFTFVCLFDYAVRSKLKRAYKKLINLFI